ncbi:J domain-containing protein [Halorarius halobius]|uniref:J domain-containing protein n=1 Tax=Halorarius halobius TaxID=2962671 RepID=UPI0020CCEB44|nr:J domain-containing protein [Halorarius halobius]
MPAGRRRREAYGAGDPTAGVDRSPLVIGLAAVFAGMTVLLVVLAAVFGDPVVALMTLPFGAATYFFWYHATGRIREGVREQARRQRARRVNDEARERGGFGAGPRFGREARTRAERQARGGGTQAGQRARAGERTRQGQRVDPNANAGPTRREAYRTLGLDQGADEADVKRAYREKVKDVHPDRGGDEETFKEVTRAYERLTD